MADIKELELRRAGIIHVMSNIYQFILLREIDLRSNFEIPEKTLFELELRLGQLTKWKNEFEAIQTSIEVACSDEVRECHYAKRTEFNDQVYSAQSTARYIISRLKFRAPKDAIVNPATQAPNANLNSENANTRPLEDNVSENNSNHNYMNVKLPTINLPVFASDISGWLEFKDTFSSLIHNNVSLTDVMKFHYLRASLKGESQKIIQSLETSAANYDVAWKLLCSRYDNSKFLIQNHLKALFSLSEIHKESSHALRTLSHTVYKHIRALKLLEERTESWDSIIIYVMSSKLDKVTAREWENHCVSIASPKLNDLQEFLRSRANFLENYEGAHLKRDLPSRTSYPKALLVQDSSPVCYFCNNTNHYIYKCEEFLNLPVPMRIEKVKGLKLCMNCLKKDHNAYNCRSGPCKKCKTLKHNSLLHVDRGQSGQTNNSRFISVNATALFALCSDSVLLSTAVIRAFDSRNNHYSCRAVLANGSQSHYITPELCKKLKLPLIPVNLQVEGLNYMQSYIKHKCQLRIGSRVCNFIHQIECFVVPQITGKIPSKDFNISGWDIPTNLALADPSFNKSDSVQLLIGAGLFWDLLTVGKVKLGKSKPTLYNSAFGLLVTGEIRQPSRNVHCNLSTKNDFHVELERFWEMEEVGSSKPLSHAEEQCENNFVNTMSRDSEGRFVVRLPLKQSASLLGDSMVKARRQFLNLEKKLSKDSSLREQYCAFMREYRELGHMSLLTRPNFNEPAYYLPHHAVLRAESLTTKLRVAFNGSSPSDTGISVNDLQYVGPPILNDIVDILLRFRYHNIVVAADIEKMYRQVNVHPNDRHLQRILWRDNPDEDLSAYELNTVVYGTTAAPFLAMRCLQQLSIECESQVPIASTMIREDFYVDDLITGFPNEETAIVVCSQIKSILDSGKFPLQKWKSNRESVVKHLESSVNETAVAVRLGNQEQSKTLGLQWNCKGDFITFHISNFEAGARVTKRTILGEVARIYDPLGLLSACVIIPKIMIQQLWALKSD